MSLGNQMNYVSQEEQDDKLAKGCIRYRYNVFGLRIATDILLPELLATIDGHDDMPEVSITVGKVPTTIISPIDQDVSYQVAKDQFLFHVPGVGCYYVTNGDSIVVEPAEQVEDRFVRLFLLGTAFGALLMQRGILPIHGSAVVIDGCCVIFTGVSGAGKSTLLAAFRERGYSFLTDDVAAVTVDLDGIPWVHAAYPQQKLSRDSAKAVGIDTSSLTTVYINKDKFTVPTHKGFWSLPMPLVAVYEIGVERCRDVTLSPLTGMDKLAVLMRHTYRSSLLDGLGLKAEHLKYCTTVAKQVAVSTLTRPEGMFSTEEQIRLVQQDFARLFDGRAV